MRAVVQRVTRASVAVEGKIAGEIGRGFLVLLGVAKSDVTADADYLAEKISGLRVFEDAAGKMNLALADVQGAVLAVSQFTLHGDVRRGKRPSFDSAALPTRPANFMNISSSACAPSACAAKAASSRR